MTANDGVLDSPTDWVAEHIRSYVETGGEDGHLFMGFPTLLLTTLGRRTGTLRRTPLIYGRDGDRYLLVASNGGSARHPAWYLNVAAHPEVTVQVRAETFSARARTATGVERRRLWPVVTEVFPRYEAYQAQTDRELPLVVVS
jgi:deazaflavin-dependent oxidoreductase (nitroreductase family)